MGNCGNCGLTSPGDCLHCSPTGQMTVALSSTIPSTPIRRPGMIADRYQIEKQIGRGGFGVVYLATDLPSLRPVALKVLLRPIDETDKEDLERFKQESLILAKPLSPSYCSCI